MTCSINFIINKQGKLETKVKWSKGSPKNIAKFRKFLLNLQTGSCNMEICEAIIKFGKENMDSNNAKKILKVLVPDDLDDNEPILFPQDLGKDINGED